VSELQGKVLVIDDNPTNLEIVVAQLGRNGYQVTTAGNGADGLAAAAQDPPDVILLDAVMGGMDGYEVCRRLKADPSTQVIPVVFLTALHEQADKIRALNLGASDFLTKPVDRAELLARVRTLLQVKSLHDGLAESASAQRVLVARLTETVDRLKGLGEMSRAISSNLDLDHVLAAIVTRAVQLSGADYGTAAEFDSSNNTLTYRASYGLSPEQVRDLQSQVDLRRPDDGGIISYVLHTRQMVHLPDVEAQMPPELATRRALYGHDRQERWRRVGTRAFLALPLMHDAEPAGVLVIQRKTPGEFAPETIQLLLAFASQSSIAIQNARLFKQLKERSEAVERERQTLAAVMAGMSDGLLVVDPESVVRYCNDRAAEFFSQPVSVLLGLNIDELMSAAGQTMLEPSESFSRLRSAMQEVAQRPAVELTLSGPPRRDLLAMLFPITGVQGVARETGILLHDVTSEHDLARTKDELISVVSHELRTPLASVVGFAELLLKRDYGEEQRREFLHLMYEEGRRLTALINDFLDLQRMESGRQTVHLRPLDLRPVMERAVQAAGEDPERPIVLIAPDDLPEVDGDPDRLLQVFTNLLSNARKYSPGGGQIRFEAVAYERSLRVEVEDHGLGLPEDAIPRLFQKFYRVDNSDRRSIAGTGLGLAICKQIVAEHGGRISVKSSGLGQGSTFSLTLSISKPNPTKGDVLIVEDDVGFARLLEAELAALGLSAVRAPSAEAALEQLAVEHFKAIALDLILPQMSGEEMLARLTNGSRVPVVIATVKELGAQERRELETRGAVGILMKGPDVAPRAAALLSAALNQEKEQLHPS